MPVQHSSMSVMIIEHAGDSLLQSVSVQHSPRSAMIIEHAGDSSLQSVHFALCVQKYLPRLAQNIDYGLTLICLKHIRISSRLKKRRNNA